MQPGNSQNMGQGPAEFADNWPKELEGHIGDPRKAIGVAPRGFQPLSGAEDVDEEALIENAPEDTEQLFDAGPSGLDI